MKSQELMYIALALAAGYWLAQQGQAQPPAAANTISDRLPGKNQSPSIFEGGAIAISGHRCACRRKVQQRYVIV